MSAGVFGAPGGFGRTADDIENEITRVVGLPAPERQGPYSGDTHARNFDAPGRASTPDPGALIGGIDVNRGIAITSYGAIQLEQGELGMIVGIVSRAMRKHLEGQLSALNNRLGVPQDVEAPAPASVRKGRKPAEQIELPLGATTGAAEGAEV